MKARTTYRTKCACVLLLAVFGTGCASTRPVRFSSVPPGATVGVGARSYDTPCVVPIRSGVTNVVFSWPDGQSRCVQVDVLPSLTRARLQKKWISISKGVGGTLVGVGGAVVYAGADSSGAGTPSLVAMGCGAAAVLVGGIIYYSGDCIDRRDESIYQDPYEIIGQALPPGGGVLNLEQVRREHGLIMESKP